jgi:3-phosphoshikimate 1-carboxyvinyltransferase
VSSQFVSGLLFALPLTEEDSEIRLESPLESRQYVEMTIDVMRRFGVEASIDDTSVHVRGGQRYRPSDYTVETDYSQAAYFLGAAALGLDVKCAGLSEYSRQGDMAILRILEEMGATIARKDGIVSVHAERLLPVTVDARETPDLIPPVASLCCYCEGRSRIVNAGRLRLKESDRLRA